MRPRARVFRPGGWAGVGAAAWLLCAGAVGGSSGAAGRLWRLIRRRAAACTTDGTGEERTERGGAPAAGETAPAATSLWNTLRGSLVIVAFFVAGPPAGVGPPPRAPPRAGGTPGRTVRASGTGIGAADDCVPGAGT